MLKLLKTIMRAGEATVKYPFAPLEVSPGFRASRNWMPRSVLPVLPVLPPARPMR